MQDLVDLAEDSIGGLGPIGGFEDGAANDEVGGAGGDGFGRGEDAGLVSKGSAGWADAWGDNGEIGSVGLAEGAGFAGGGDQASAASGEGELGQSEYLLFGGAGDPDFGEIGVRQTGEDGYGQKQRLGCGLGSGFDGGFEHLAAARGVDVEHGDAEVGGFGDGGGDGVGDVVELQVQKDFTAGGDEIADDLRAFGGEQLLAYFVEIGRFANGVNDLASLRGGGEVERHDEPIPDRHRPIIPREVEPVATKVAAGRKIATTGAEQKQCPLKSLCRADYCDPSAANGLMLVATVGVSITSRRTLATPESRMPRMAAAP